MAGTTDQSYAPSTGKLWRNAKREQTSGHRIMHIASPYSCVVSELKAVQLPPAGNQT